ncbi:DNA polymerase alpha-associated DNA helicase A-like protein [Drosera capensis]
MALHPIHQGSNMHIIQSVLQAGASFDDHCSCILPRKTINTIRSFHLDKSQEDAIRTSISMLNCSHQDPIKLIWGPPGSGKTKTVVSLLQVLLRMKYRTLICAPTNIAILQVVDRLVRQVAGTLYQGFYSLGDIVWMDPGRQYNNYMRNKYRTDDLMNDEGGKKKEMKSVGEDQDGAAGVYDERMMKKFSKRKRQAPSFD